MIQKIRPKDPNNLWNRLARNLIYDAKALLLYCGIEVPRRKQNGVEVDYSDIIQLTTKGTDYGAIFDPNTRRIHFEPGYIQSIVDQAYRFDFPVLDRSFGPGGIAGFIHNAGDTDEDLTAPTINHILKQAMLTRDNELPYSFVSARQLGNMKSNSSVSHPTFSMDPNSLMSPRKKAFRRRSIGYPPAIMSLRCIRSSTRR